MVDLPDENSPLSCLPAPNTLVAVALEGKKGQSAELAKVIASGRGVVAEQILALAHEKGIKVREDADLAELLATLSIDSPIPTEAVIAVAEILVKVYEANALLSTQSSLVKDDP